jgi:hypothetical protein
MQSLPRHATIVATADQVWCDLGTEAAILHVTSGRYYGLDAVGTRIWALVQQPVAVAQLHATLLAEYDVAPEQLERDLAVLLRRLAALGLIEVRDDVAA